jgi:hypothetical protein
VIVVILFDFVVQFSTDRDKSLDALRAVVMLYATKALRFFARMADGATTTTGVVYYYYYYYCYCVLLTTT